MLGVMLAQPSQKEGRLPSHSALPSGSMVCTHKQEQLAATNILAAVDADPETMVTSLLLHPLLLPQAPCTCLRRPPWLCQVTASAVCSNS